MSQTYTQVGWVTNDWCTKEKINTMIGNDEFFKQEGPDFQTLFVGDVIAIDGDLTHTTGVRVYLSTSRVYSGASGYLLGTYAYSDDSTGTAIEATALIDHEIDMDVIDNEEVFITFVLDYGSTAIVYQQHCWITVQTKYLSMWLTPFYISNTHGAHSVTILAHAATQGWS